MPVGTVIYGSGDGSSMLSRSPRSMSPVDALGQALLLPFTLPLQIVESLRSGPGYADGYGGRIMRQFTPHGEVVQEMTTRQLNSKNIFGAGGSQ